MKIYVKVKKAGSRRPVLERQEYELPFTKALVRDLLAFLVKEETERYNRQSEAAKNGKVVLKYLTEKEVDEAAGTGKVAFGEHYREGKADLQTAVANALQCYEDGLFRVFRNDEELTDPDQVVEFSDGDELILIRLTFLTGLLW